MNLKSLNLKLVLGAIYLAILIAVLYFIFSRVDIQDLTNYEFIMENRETIFKYKNENFLLFYFIFFVGIIFWNLILGIGSIPAIIGGFIFGKWWGTIILILGNTIGATLFYFLAKTFFSEFIEYHLSKKFSKFIIFIKKNELLYFTIFRLIGGGGAPLPIQNTLPVVFNMSIKNYMIGTFLGIIPTTFITVALGSGIESVIEKNTKLTFSSVFYSPEIYIPIFCFLIILIAAFILKRIFF